MALMLVYKGNIEECLSLKEKLVKNNGFLHILIWNYV